MFLFMPSTKMNLYLCSLTINIETSRFCHLSIFGQVFMATGKNAQNYLILGHILVLGAEVVSFIRTI